MRGEMRQGCPHYQHLLLSNKEDLTFKQAQLIVDLPNIAEPLCYSSR